MIPANKIFVVEASQDYVTATGEKVQRGCIKFLPYQWQDTRGQSLIDRMKEICASTAKECENLPYEAVLLKVKERALNRTLQQSWWTPCTISETVRAKILGVTSEKYSLSHIPDTFPGAFYKWSDGEQPMSQDELAQTFVYIRIAIREAQRRDAKHRR